jgi:hypothetical protein
MSSVDRLLRKSVVARDHRGCSTRHLSTLIERGEWPPPDVKATKLGEADYYFESTAVKAREQWLRSRGFDVNAERACEEIQGTPTSVQTVASTKAAAPATSRRRANKPTLSAPHSPKKRIRRRKG